MVLTLRSYIAASVFLHALFLGAFTFNFRDLWGKSAPSPKPSSTMTLRSRPKTAKPATTTKQVQVVQTPKLIPKIRNDVTESTPMPVAPTQPEVVGDPNATVDGVESGGEGGQDLTSDASLILGSLKKPEYTKEAIKARIQGLFAVDIHVDATGKVLEVEVIQSPGYGMDERIIDSLKNAKFSPKKNAQGIGQETWITIQFKLEIP